MTIPSVVGATNPNNPTTASEAAKDIPASTSTPPPSITNDTNGSTNQQPAVTDDTSDNLMEQFKNPSARQATTAEPPKKADEPPAKQQDTPPVKKDEPSANKPAELPKIKLDLNPKDKKDTLQEPPQGTTTEARNYEGLSDEEQSIFKRMSNEAFNKLKPIYDEYKKLKPEVAELRKKVAEGGQVKVGPNGLPSDYLQHDEAYILSPTFKQLEQATNRAQFEADFWQQQMELHEEGKKSNLLALDQQGNYIRGQELNPDAKSKALITANLQKALNIVNQREQQLNYYAGQHKGLVQQAADALRKAEDEYFPHYKDPENPHKELIAQVRSIIPEPYQNNPLASIVAKAYATMVEMQKQITELQAKSQTAAGIKEDVKKAGPSGDKLGIQPNGHKTAGEELDENLMTEFNKIKDRAAGRI